MSSNSRASTVELFYDGGCPLCSREVRFLKRRNSNGLIRFTDIDAPGFRPDADGPGLDVLMARIHARLPDGTWVEGVEVFRRLYTAIGFGPLVALTRLPGIVQLLDSVVRALRQASKGTVRAVYGRDVQPGARPCGSGSLGEARRTMTR